MLICISVGSVVISRKRDMAATLNPHAAEENVVDEMYMPEPALSGLLPECLLETYGFWRTSDTTLRGYPKQGSTPKQLLVVLQQGVTYPPCPSC